MREIFKPMTHSFQRRRSGRTTQGWRVGAGERQSAARTARSVAAAALIAGLAMLVPCAAPARAATGPRATARSASAVVGLHRAAELPPCLGSLIVPGAPAAAAPCPPLPAAARRSLSRSGPHAAATGQPGRGFSLGRTILIAAAAAAVTGVVVYFATRFQCPAGTSLNVAGCIPTPTPR